MLKRIVLSLTCLISTGTTLAGPDYIKSAQNFMAKHPLYVEAHVGTAWQDWTSVQNSLLDDLQLPAAAQSAASVDWSGGENRFAYGINIGWRIMDYVSVEGGWFNFSDAGFTGTSSTTDSSDPPQTTNYRFNGSIKSWMTYAGFKVSLLHNEADDMRLTAKIAIAYTHNTYNYDATIISPSGTTESTAGSFVSNAWSPLFGIAGELDLNSKIYITAEYLQILSSSSHSSSAGGGVFQQPEGYIGSGAIGVHF